MKKWSLLLAALIALEAISITMYLVRAGGSGFPLDDAWIHQTYARNLALHGTMSFSPGVTSTGSTSFLWTLILAIGYSFHIPFYFWAYLWGGFFAVATAMMAAWLSEVYFGNFKYSVIVAILCILEWHLAWAAVSGMEIGLFTCLTLLFFVLLKQGASPLSLGGLTGIIVLTRPEGILLVPIFLSYLLVEHRAEPKKILLSATTFFLIFLIAISPWVAFNLIHGQRPFPSTITAKFMHYAYPWTVWKSIQYLWQIVLYFVNGPLLLLLPGSVYVMYRSIRMKNAQRFPLLWSFTLIALYAVALPVIYDQGRYLMPIIPFIIIYGVEGLGQLLEMLHSTRLTRSVIWALLFGMVAFLWNVGASDFSYRANLYNKIHMQVAKWINDHAAPDAVLATHDIGIIGYFTERQIVDLAGLITPEIVPIMENPQEMTHYLRTRHVDYLIVFSGYYHDLLTSLDAHVVFSPEAEQLRAQGMEPFEVYELTAP